MNDIDFIAEHCPHIEPIPGMGFVCLERSMLCDEVVDCPLIIEILLEIEKERASGGVRYEYLEKML